ncbi:hypothetical protein PCE1_002843 [Barthelona sp. PCE]
MPRFIQADFITKQGNLVTNTSYLPRFGTQFSIIQQEQLGMIPPPPIIVHSEANAKKIPFLPKQCRCSSLFYDFNDGKLVFLNYLMVSSFSAMILITECRGDVPISLQNCSEEDVGIFRCVNSSSGRVRDCYFTVCIDGNNLIGVYLNEAGLLKSCIMEHKVLNRIFNPNSHQTISMRIYGHTVYKDVIIYNKHAFFIADNEGVPFLADEYLYLEKLPYDICYCSVSAIYTDSVLCLISPLMKCMYTVSSIGIHTDSTCTTIERLMSKDEELFMYTNGAMHRIYVTKAQPSTLFTIGDYAELYKPSEMKLPCFATSNMYIFVNSFCKTNAVMAFKGCYEKIKNLVFVGEKVFVQYRVKFEMVDVYDLYTQKILYSTYLTHLENDAWFADAVASEKHLLIDGRRCIIFKNGSMFEHRRTSKMYIEGDVGYVVSMSGIVTAFLFDSIGGFSKAITFENTKISEMTINPWAPNTFIGYNNEGIVHFISFDFENGNVTEYTLELQKKPNCMQFIDENTLIIDDQVFTCTLDDGYELMSATLPYEENSAWICNREHGAIRIDRVVTNLQINGHYISYNSSSDSFNFEPFCVKLLDFLQHSHFTVLSDFFFSTKSL